ncbi:DUF3396 domain-containing protein [Mitsuaria sp. CC2]|uniref:type VI immunity family protein n=1 Tax=Mitsuaria sp. CC2 TaxID=3029186 RepID=UPI003B8AAC0E
MSPQEETIVFSDGDEVLALRTLGATLFFDTGPKAEGVLPALLATLERVLPQARWVRAGSARRNQAVSATTAQKLRTLAEDAARQRTDLSIVIDSGEVGDGVGPWALKYSCSPSYDGQIVGYLQVHMPVTEPAQRLRDWVADAVGRSGFLHGYGGLALNFDHNDINRARGKALHAHVMRYAGVSLSDLIAEKENLQTELKGAQWLTYVGDAMLARDPDAAKALSGHPGAARIGAGVLVQAAAEPLEGDVNRGADLSAYRRVNALLAPWLVDNLFPLPGFPDEEATREWLHRLRP